MSDLAAPGTSVRPVPYVWSADVLAHQPRREVWVGVPTEAVEVPARATVIREALRVAGHPEVASRGFTDDHLLAVHDPSLVDWLRTAHGRWAAGDYEQLVGQDRVVPYVFATPGLTAGMPARTPTAVHALAGTWCYDTMTPIGPGTWSAARAAVDVALTAASLVLDGEPAAYALCRPPGHHAAPRGFGGSCYLNNAAVATQALTRAGRRVALVDVDAHHGNGTQAIFWRRPDVLYASVHVDPGAGWFPHVLGYADEVGDGPGRGSTLNLPLPPGSGDDRWLEAVQKACEAATDFGADTLVVSLGMDAFADDPESPLQVTTDGYARTGRLLADLALPSVLVHEGGYHLPSLGQLVTTTLTAFAGPAPDRG